MALIRAQSRAELGFVRGHEAVTGDVAAPLAYLPAAVFMTTNESVAARLLLYCRQWLTAAPHLPVAIISSSERCISERRLDQPVSSRAPYMEDVLDAFVTRTREARCAYCRQLRELLNGFGRSCQCSDRKSTRLNSSHT